MKFLSNFLNFWKSKNHFFKKIYVISFFPPHEKRLTHFSAPSLIQRQNLSSLYIHRDILPEQNFSTIPLFFFLSWIPLSKTRDFHFSKDPHQTHLTPKNVRQMLPTLRIIQLGRKLNSSFYFLKISRFNPFFLSPSLLPFLQFQPK